MAACRNVSSHREGWSLDSSARLPVKGAQATNALLLPEAGASTFLPAKGEDGGPRIVQVAGARSSRQREPLCSLVCAGSNTCLVLQHLQPFSVSHIESHLLV